MIVIPMAGLSSRFLKAGFTLPKYMLNAHGKTLFEHSVSSFKNYFKEEMFLFIVRDVFNTAEFVREKAKYLGIKNFEIIVLNKETKGQAETVYFGVSYINYHGPITIFNIDSIRNDFIYPKIKDSCCGYLEVFEGEGENWSFVKPLGNSSTIVLETAEKNRISNLCCTGLYYFSDVNHYCDALNEYMYLPVNEWAKGELYVAPLYNILIKNGAKIKYSLIDRTDVIFSGVPEEYYEFQSHPYNQ